MGYRFDSSPEIAKALQREAREAVKLKLLQDILLDINICRLEGWDYREYLEELKELIDGFCRKETEA